MKLRLGICNISGDTKHNDATTIDTYNYIKRLLEENRYITNSRQYN